MEAATNVLAGHNVVVATDGSDDAGLAAVAGAEICQAIEGRLHLVHVLPSIYAPLIEGFDLFEAEGRRILEGESARAAEAGVNEVETHLLTGSPFAEVVGLSQALGRALIVVGSRGLGPLQRLTLGSVSEGVVHHSRYPVLVMRGGAEAWPPARVLMADDGSETAREASNAAAGLASIFGASGTLLRAYPAPAWAYPVSPPGKMAASGEEKNALALEIEKEVERDSRKLEARAEELAGILGNRPDTETVIGDPAQLILEAASREEGGQRTLTAVGSRGQGALRRMSLGSVSTKVLRAAPGPVLVHPPALG